ncbi:MAG: ABC transporter substrate-binding protein [Thermoplasmata archaeon]
MATEFSRRTFLSGVGAASLASLSSPVLVPRRAWGAQKPIKIGLLMSFSGVVAAWGQAGRQGLKMAMDEINSQGGVLGRPLVMKAEDDTVNGGVAVRKARRLVLDWGADTIIGFNASGVALAVTPVMPELKRILIVPCAASPSITNEKGNKYVFRVHANCYQIGAGGAAIAASLPLKRWTVIGPDYSYGWDSWGAFISHLLNRKPSVDVLSVQAWPKFAAGAYDSHITKILDAKPDGVYCPLWGGDFVTFVKQAHRHKFFDQVGAFLTPAGLAMDAFYALASWRKRNSEVPPGIYTSAHGYWPEHPQTARHKAWVDRFVDQEAEFPHVTAHDTYSAVYFYKKALEKAGTTNTEAVITALEGMELESPAYKKVIRKEDHQAVTDVPWGVTKEAKDLEPLFVRVADIRDSKGEEIIEPVGDILERKKSGAKPPWRKHVIKG